MSTLTKAIRYSRFALLAFAPICLALIPGTPAAAADSCASKSFEIDVPDASTLKLTDGLHTIARARAPHGEFEVRVRVKGGGISENEFWANGKRLLGKLDPKTPGEFVKCLKEQKVEISAVGFAEELLRGLSDLVEHPAEAKASKACVLKVTASCYEYASGKFWCAYRVCCGSCHTEFDPVP